LELKKSQCLVTKNDSYTFKSWCDQPLDKLLAKNGDEFCTAYPGYYFNRKDEDLKANLKLAWWNSTKFTK